MNRMDRVREMEEPWMDMSLHYSPAAAAAYLHDYLAAPHEPPRTPPPPHTALTLAFTYLGQAGANSTSSGDLQDYLGQAGANSTSSGDLQDYLAAPHEPPLPHRPALPLEFTYLDPPSSSTSFGDMLDPLAFSSFPDTNNRRDAVGGAAGDLRQRRMIKHRASGARSRARQHAYTKDLERELAQFRRDNQMLIKDLHARLALPPAQVLPRCRSAPPAP